jgi:bile acid-coenzyme A ligase
MEAQPSLVQRLRQVAAERPDEVVHTHLRADGTERELSGAELDRRSSQLAAAMAARGLGVGDRLALRCGTPPSW